MTVRNVWINSHEDASGNSSTALSPEEERWLFNHGFISRCEFEFGLHEDVGHDDCDRMIAMMNGDDAIYAHDVEYDNYLNGSSHIGFSVFSE